MKELIVYLPFATDGDNIIILDEKCGGYYA